LNKIFHDEYFSRVHRASLADDALEAIALTEQKGWNQSVLSMTTHDELVEIVASHGITDRFVLIEGLQTPTGGLKAAHLEQHLAKLGIDPANAVVVGDTPDDAMAAQTVGSSVVLYDGGSHHVPVLVAAAAPVAHTLLSAIEKAA
jgi:phosphoglycolate phosphatase-like HAD superfamily hydrolase